MLLTWQLVETIINHQIPTFPLDVGPVQLKKEAKAWTEFQRGEDKGYDVILVEKGKGFMQLKLCEV